MKFQNTYSALGHKFCAHQLPTNVASPRLIKFNSELASDLGVEFLKNDAAQTLSGNQIPEGCEPIAQAYAGHQFGHLNILGDGRAILLGEIETKDGLFDMVLKGAGRTPYSRGGDGRAALGPVLREYLVSEAMHKLGVPTTRALGFVLSGEDILRENLETGAILTRIAKSHIRVGTFTYFSVHREFIALKQLADYVINRHYPNANNYAQLLEMICINQAKLIAKWMSLGFIHGVMNTDNMAISGETIDYGPCAFMDEYNPSQVYSFIDKRGRYQYQNQPNIAAWNLARLAEAFLPLLHDDEQTAIKTATQIIEEFPNIYETEWLYNMRLKFGFLKNIDGDKELINEFLHELHILKLDFTNGFRPIANHEFDNDFSKDWQNKWRLRLEKEDYDFSHAAKIMNANNAFIIPRNHQIQNAIDAANKNDFSVFERLNKAFANPYEQNDEYKDLCAPPLEQEIVQNTFCGT